MNLVTPPPLPAAHDAFDWWAGIWLPLAFGGVTVVVSVVSIWFAIAALRAAKESNQLAIRVASDARRDKRAELARLVQKAVDAETANWWNGTHDKNASWDGMSDAITAAQRAGAAVPEFVVRQAMNWHENIDHLKLERPTTWLLSRDLYRNTMPMLDTYVEVENYNPTMTERTFADLPDLTGIEPLPDDA